MSNELEYDWNESKIIDDIEFKDEDAKLFQQLLNNREEKATAGSISSMEVVPNLASLALAIEIFYVQRHRVVLHIVYRGT